MDWLTFLDRAQGVVDRLSDLDRDVGAITGPSGSWEKHVTESVSGSDGLTGIGAFNFQGAVTVSVHLTKSASPPIDVGAADTAERDSVWATLEIAGQAGSGLSGSLPVQAGASVVYGIHAGATVRLAHHRRFPQHGSTGLTILKSLAGTLKNPFDVSAARALGPDEVLQFDYQGSLALQASAGWDRGWARTIRGNSLENVAVQDLPGVVLDVKAGLTVSASLDGELRLLVAASQRRPGQTWVTVHKQSSSAVGAGFSLSAAVAVTQIDTGVAGFIRDTLEPTPEQEQSQTYQTLLKSATSAVCGWVEEGLTAELTAAVNRASTNEALVDFDIDLGRCSETYLQVLRGNLDDALRRARSSEASGVELNACALKHTSLLKRTMALRLNLLGFDLSRDLATWSQQQLTTGSDGAVWITGSAGASLKQTSGDDLESMSFVFDLASSAETASPGGDGAVVTATLKRRQEEDTPAAIAVLIPRHIQGSVALGLWDTGEASRIEQQLLRATGPYAVTIDMSFQSAAVRRLFMLDRPDIDDAAYAKILWRYFRQALNLLDATIPTTDPARPCPMSRLVTEHRIGQISYQPFIALQNPPTAVDAAGYSIPLVPGARRFWLHLGNVYAFFASLVKARRALRTRTTVERLDRELAALARLAAALRMQVGAVKGCSVEAKYLVLPLMAGNDACSARMTFQRGDPATGGISVTV